MEVLEKAQNTNETLDTAWNKRELGEMYSIQSERICKTLRKRSSSARNKQRETNPVWISLNVRLLHKKSVIVKLIEPPCTERYARWCERSAALAASYSIGDNSG